MAEKTINVNLPKATEASKSIEIIEAVKTTVANGDVVTVEKAFENKTTEESTDTPEAPASAE